MALDRPITLTRRERQILDGRRRGLALKEIAQELDIHLGTVKTHLSRIYLKTGAHDSLGSLWKFTPSHCKHCPHFWQWQ